MTGLQKYWIGVGRANSIQFFVVVNFAKPLRGGPTLSSFSREYTENTGGRGNGCCTLFKMLIIVHILCICIQGR